MSQNVYGIDIGTSNLKIFNGQTKTIINEKNIIAIRNKKDVFAIGNGAFEMYEKAPDNIVVSFPIKDGVIADIKNMKSLIEKMFIKLNYPKIVRGGRFCIAVPSDITEVEKRAFYDVINDSSIKAKKIKIVEKPIADAVGLGIDIDSAKGNMIVNIGADTTEITVTSLGGIVISRIVKIGGNKLDEIICNIVKRKYNIMIGMKTAEQIKINLANAIYDEESDDNYEMCNVFGRNIITGLPCERTVTSDLIYEAIKEVLSSIIDSIKQLLERTPPELSSDIIDTGIYLTGGSAQITNLSKLIEMETDLKVNVVRNPGESVVRGISKIISDSKYRKLLYTPSENKY